MRSVNAKKAIYFHTSPSSFFSLLNHFNGGYSNLSTNNLRCQVEKHLKTSIFLHVHELLKVLMRHDDENFIFISSEPPFVYGGFLHVLPREYRQNGVYIYRMVFFAVKREQPFSFNSCAITALNNNMGDVFCFSLR